MLELVQSIDVLVAVCILAGLASALVLGISALRWVLGQRQNDHRADPRYAQLLRKTPF